MNKVTKKELRKTALKLLPAIYDSAMRTGAEDGLFQHEDWRTGLCLDAFLLAEAFENAAAYRDAEPEPKLKQLDQSVFDHEFVTDHFKYAALNSNGQSIFFSDKPKYNLELGIWYSTAGSTMPMLKGYDASNWQNSLIERDTAKELLEVDLSSELTGSELCRAMINRGDKIVLCIVRDYEHENDTYYDAITHCSGNYFESSLSTWSYAIPINNQGEPLTASEVGL